MSPVNANDRIILDDDEETTENADLRQHYFEEILSGKTTIQVISKCEGCGTDLRTPMVVFIPEADDDDEPRDSSILCNEDCA